MIDFRSDTVTQPCDAMRQAMASAPVGDDVFGDDPTVNRLQDHAAELLGYEAALFTASGTQANLIALLTHCQRGDEYICGQQAHNYIYEGGGAAVLGGIQPQPLENAPDGTIPLEKIAAAVKVNDIHFARSRLLSLENTINGKVLSFDYLADAEQLARDNGLATHLDGARLFNAVVSSGRPVTDITRYFDTASLCLSKGLGAPVGSLLLGSRAYINDARRWRKVCGGGMRQAGILAAAGQYALEHNINRLVKDHDNALLLANLLSELPQLKVDVSAVQTNMVFVDMGDVDVQQLAEHLKQQGILIYPGKKLRLVTHKDIHKRDVMKLVAAMSLYLG